MRFSANLSFLFKDAPFVQRFARARAAGDRGLLSDPDRQQVFRENVPVALELADKIGCRRLNALVGVRFPELELEAQLELARQSVAWAAEQAQAQGASIMIEAINKFENGPYLLDTTAQAVNFIDTLGADSSYILELLDRSGYAGWVGLEYNPSTPTTEESLGWIAELGYA